MIAISIISCTSENSTSDAGNTNGTNGSYTKILVVGDFLYGVNDSELNTVDISNPESPFVVDSQTLGFGIESIFHHNGVLLIGSTTRMFIYQLDQGIPQAQSTTDYVAFSDNTTLPCDPIVANNTHAYVTLSIDQTTTVLSECGGTRPVELSLSELRIFDIKDLTNPDLITTVDMHNPKGLSLDGNHLFVCNDDKGIVVFDVSDPFQPEAIFIKDDFFANDIIALDGLLIVVGKDQLRQFDYNDINNIQELSTIDL